MIRWNGFGTVSDKLNKHPRDRRKHRNTPSSRQLAKDRPSPRARVLWRYFKSHSSLELASSRLYASIETSSWGTDFSCGGSSPMNECGTVTGNLKLRGNLSLKSPGAKESQTLATNSK